MSGRGVWWEVQLVNGDSLEVHYMRGAEIVYEGIDATIARMAYEGEADAMAAVLECPDDVRLQRAVREYEEKK